jgi:hypothetical protein
MVGKSEVRPRLRPRARCLVPRSKKNVTSPRDKFHGESIGGIVHTHSAKCVLSGPIGGIVYTRSAKSVLSKAFVGVRQKHHAIFTYVPPTTLRQGLGYPGGGRPLRRYRDRVLFFVGPCRFEFNPPEPDRGGPSGTCRRPRPRPRRRSLHGTAPGGARGQRWAGVDPGGGGDAVVLLAPALGHQALLCRRRPKR